LRILGVNIGFGKPSTVEERPEVRAAVESSKRVVNAAKTFSEHTDVLGNMVRNMKGKKSSKRRGGKS